MQLKTEESTMHTASDVKKLLKANGINTKAISVRVEYGSTRVRLKDFAIKSSEVEKLLGQFHKVRRCEATGDYLSGGNHFVMVDYDYSACEIPAVLVDGLLDQKWAWCNDEGDYIKERHFTNGLEEDFPSFDRNVCLHVVREVIHSRPDFRAAHNFSF